MRAGAEVELLLKGDIVASGRSNDDGAGVGFFKPQDVAFSSSPGGSTKVESADEGVEEGTGVSAARGVEKSSDDFTSKNS